MSVRIVPILDLARTTPEDIQNACPGVVLRDIDFFSKGYATANVDDPSLLVGRKLTLHGKPIKIFPNVYKVPNITVPGGITVETQTPQRYKHKDGAREGAGRETDGRAPSEDCAKNTKASQTPYWNVREVPNYLVQGAGSHTSNEEALATCEDWIRQLERTQWDEAKTKVFNELPATYAKLHSEQCRELPIALLPSKAVSEFIGSSTVVVRLSTQTLEKLLRKHPDIFEHLLHLQQFLMEAEMIKDGREGKNTGRHLLCVAQTFCQPSGDRAPVKYWFKAAIKATMDGTRLYLVSFHKIWERNLREIRETGQNFDRQSSTCSNDAVGCHDSENRIESTNFNAESAGAVLHEHLGPTTCAQLSEAKCHHELVLIVVGLVAFCALCFLNRK